MPPKPSYAQQWTQRLTYALLVKQLRDGAARVTQEAIAAGVAKHRGGSAPTRQAVSQWMRGEAVPDAETQIAVALWLGVDPGWFVAGDLSEAPAPVTPARKLSVDLTPAANARRKMRRQ